MKAIVYHDYGSADVLKLEEVEKPAPKNDEVLIKVRAASVNPLDWRMMRGKPKIAQVIGTVMGINSGRPGVDVAGEVEAVGAKVTQFKKGDQVFGACRGAFAEYTCSAESKIAAMPASATFEEAASINVAGLTAVQGLRDKAQLKPGQKVLINGAAGGVGTFAVQIAKHFGAHVTGVCSTRNVELVRSIGADAAIDYTKEDFTKLPERYDVILDNVGNKSLSEFRSVLTANGRLVIVGGPHDPSILDMLGTLLGSLALSIFTSKKTLMFIAKASQSDLAFIGGLISAGKLKPVIDHVYDLNEAADAVRHVEEGHARGKVIVAVSSGQ
jgi:NADPH:quinone reductase-like Zn-dependent oxidoreductase